MASCDLEVGPEQLPTATFATHRSAHYGRIITVQVRHSGYESDRHRERSTKFFYSMLIAQLGVTVASLALARQQRNWLWLVAALAGFTALTFSGYVYLTP